MTKMAEPLPTRKRIRLAPTVYQGVRAFSVTVSTAHRQNLFSDGRAVTLCLSALKKASTREEMEMIAYCFMPDHLHLLLEGKEGSNLIAFMKAFKQTSGYRYRRAFHETLWQKGYYDHVLRKEEDVRSVAEYIFHNPTRAGLVNSPSEYPFLGGTLLASLRAT